MRKSKETSFDRSLYSSSDEILRFYSTVRGMSERRHSDLTEASPFGILAIVNGAGVWSVSSPTAFALEGIGFESTKVVSRNWPKEDAPPSATLD